MKPGFDDYDEDEVEIEVDIEGNTSQMLTTRQDITVENTQRNLNTQNMNTSQDAQNLTKDEILEDNYVSGDEEICEEGEELPYEEGDENEIKVEIEEDPYKYKGKIYRPDEFIGHVQHDLEYGGDINVDNTLELKHDLDIRLVNNKKKEVGFIGYINPKTKTLNFLLMIIFWIATIVLLIGTYVLAFIINRQKAEQSPMSHLVILLTTLIFVNGGIATVFTTRWIHICHEIDEEKSKEAFENRIDKAVQKQEGPISANQEEDTIEVTVTQVEEDTIEVNVKKVEEDTTEVNVKKVEEDTIEVTVK